MISDPRYAPTEVGDHLLLPPGTAIGEFEIDELIGRGGMGEVYGATHPVIGKRAAIKVLAGDSAGNPEAAARFVREARAVNEIRHPNIVDIFSFGELDDGRAYFVMELLEGESLGERLRRGELPNDQALEVLDQVMAAVEAAHGCDIIHRDLKPDNIFLETRGDWTVGVKLLDFGIAKLGDPLPDAHATRTGVMMGTPLYMPPEQATGRNITKAVDVYAAGGVAFATLSGRAPFVADSAAEIIAMHLHQSPPPLRTIRPDVGRGLEALVTEMLAKAPEDRPSVAEVRRRLAALRTGDVYEPDRRTRMWTLGGAVSVVAMVVIIALVFGGGDEVNVMARGAPPARRPAAAAPAAQVAGGAIAVVLPGYPVSVWIDGRKVELPSGGARLRFKADGVHEIAATAPGREPFRRRIEVSGGVETRVEVALDRAFRAKKSRVKAKKPPARIKKAKPTPAKPRRRDPDAPIDDPF